MLLEVVLRKVVTAAPGRGPQDQTIMMVTAISRKGQLCFRLQSGSFDALALVVRMYESAGLRVSTSIELASVPVGSVVVADLIERSGEGTEAVRMPDGTAHVPVTLRPFEVKTLRVKPQRKRKGPPRGVEHLRAGLFLHQRRPAPYVAAEPP